jgi:hypothetical protein
LRLNRISFICAIKLLKPLFIIFQRYLSNLFIGFTQYNYNDIKDIYG